jgi:hypothetical protein
MIDDLLRVIQLVQEQRQKAWSLYPICFIFKFYLFTYGIP